MDLIRLLDTGAEKKKLCLSLGADRWIDFKESKDIVADIKAATGGQGAHSAVVTTASVGGLIPHSESKRSYLSCRAPDTSKRSSTFEMEVP